MKRIRFEILAALVLSLSACGVKGPPLPPVADTPDASDRASVSGSAADPTPSPTPSPTPVGKKKKKTSR